MRPAASIPLTLLAMCLTAPGQTAFSQTVALNVETPVAPVLESCSYIGVATSIAPSGLREQLNLPRGVGLVIDDVEPGSPAEQAGLAVHDVIEKFNDQWIINVQQFSVLVRMQKPGDAAQLSIIHAGRRSEVKLVLAGKMMPAIDDAPVWLRPGSAPIPRPGVGRVTGIVTHSDDATTITITAREDDRQVVIRDRAGNMLFEGPLNTPEQWDKLPAALRDKVERVERNSADRLTALRNGVHGREPTTAPNTASNTTPNSGPN